MSTAGNCFGSLKARLKSMATAGPTWTQELLILVLAERTGIRVSITTMCRLLRQLGIRLNRPKPTVNCPWPKSRRTAAPASNSAAG